MKLKIKTLLIENFKGVTSPILMDFGDTLTCIYGANHTGKTTTMDAVMWLLFGKNSVGETSFGIDPLDQNGNIIHNLENCVQATMLANEREITLKRVRKEVWKKVRGEDTNTYSHTTNFYVDGNKMTEKEYKAYIATQMIESEDVFKAITNPAYFPSLKPADQRTMLVQMVGEITNEEVTQSIGTKYNSTITDMKGASLEEHKRHIAYKIREIKSELDTLPGRIAENQMPLTEIQSKGYNYDRIEWEIGEINKRIVEIDKQLTDMNELSKGAFARVQEARKKVDAIEQEMQEASMAVAHTNRMRQMKHEEELQKINNQIKAAESRLYVVGVDSGRYKSIIDKNELNKVDIRKRWQEVEDMTFTWMGDENCPTCGQRLPEESIANAKIKAEAQFQRAKQKAQDELDKDIERVKDTDTKYNAMLADAEKQEAELNVQIAKLQTERATIANRPVPQEDWNTDPRHEEMLTRLSEAKKLLLQTEKEITNDSVTEVQTMLKAERNSILAKKEQLQEIMMQKEMSNRYGKRITELLQQEDNLNQQLTQYEQMEDEATEFEFAKIKLLQDRVNQLFNYVEFKMFNKLMNGTMEPTCECMLHGTPYQDLSNSEKINAGLDIINAICRYHQDYAPIWIDNAEAVNEMMPTESQQIQLIVSRDTTLKIIK